MQRWLLNFPGSISLPHPLNRMGHELGLGVTDAVAGITTKQVLILITFSLQHLGHLVIRFHPVVHAVTHDVWIKVISIANGDKQANRLLGTARDDRLMKSPGPVGMHPATVSKLPR